MAAIPYLNWSSGLADDVSNMVYVKGMTKSEDPDEPSPLQQFDLSL